MSHVLFLKILTVTNFSHSALTTNGEVDETLPLLLCLRPFRLFPAQARFLLADDPPLPDPEPDPEPDVFEHS